jgi:hypothetical protein
VFIGGQQHAADREAAGARALQPRRQFNSWRQCVSARRDSFWVVAAVLGAGVCRGKAAPRLILKKKRKQDAREATLRMVSSRRGRSAGISDFNATFAQDHAPASLSGQGLCHLKSEMRINSLLSAEVCAR